MDLFEFIGKESDPIFQQIQSLEVGQSFKVGELQVSLHKFYEIESDREHVPFADAEHCYRYLNDAIVGRV